MPSLTFCELIVIRGEFIKQAVNIFLHLRSIFLHILVDEIVNIHAKSCGYSKRHTECHIRKITFVVFKLLDLSRVTANR